MRMPRRDKQDMYYALSNGTTKEYQRDAQGNIEYITVDGVQVPVSTGKEVISYATPVPFKASISSELNEMHIKSYGVDQSSIYSEIACRKGYLPLKIGAIIWRTTEIEWEDADHTIPQASSSDYTVVGLMDEGLTEDFFLLQRNSNEN